MSTIANKLTRINAVKEEIQDILSTDSEVLETYPNRIAKAIVDTPTEQSYNGTRTLSGIKDGIAYVDKVKGKSMVWNQLISKGIIRQAGNATFTEINNMYRVTLNIDATANYNAYISVRTFTSIATHYYLTITDVIADKDGMFTFDFNGMLPTAYHSIVSYQQKRCATISLCSANTTKSLAFYPREKTDGYLQGEGFSMSIPMIFDLTQMFGSGNEPNTPDEFAQRLGYASIDDLPYFEYDEGSLLSFNATSIQSKDADANVIDTHSFNIADIKDSNGETLFPYGLMSLDDTYDEINGEKAIKRIGYDGTTRTILATPIEVNLSTYKQYYKVENGGTETLVAEGNTTPLIADIGYRSAMSAEELVNTLNDTLNN